MESVTDEEFANVKRLLHNYVGMKYSSNVNEIKKIAYPFNIKVCNNESFCWEIYYTNTFRLLVVDDVILDIQFG